MVLCTNFFRHFVLDVRPGALLLIVISYETEELLNLCVESHRAENTIGGPSARLLQTFIADAEAFENAMELIRFLGNDAEVALAKTLSISIGSSYRIQLIAVGINFDIDAQGKIDWASVTRLKLVSIVQT